MIHTTLNRIKAHSPCEDGWKKLLKHLGKTKADDARLSFAIIVKSNGLADALWCCQAEPQYAKEWRLYAVWCARQMQHLMTDPRSVAAAWAAASAWDAAEAAAGAAWAAAGAAGAAWAAAGDAARAATAAWDAQRVEFLRVVTTTRSRKP
jgi:hypothetical protein